MSVPAVAPAVVSTAEQDGTALLVIAAHPDDETLGASRLAQWRSALQVLGATEAGVTHLPDGRLAAYESLLVERVRCAADRWRTDDGLVIAAPYAHDPHPDHQAAGRAHADALACFDSQLTPLRPDLTPVVPAEMPEHQRAQLLLPGQR